MARYYVDTCIWLDYLENRVDKFRPLGEWAFEFLKKITFARDTIVVSDVLQEELLKHIDAKKLNEMLFPFVMAGLIIETKSTTLISKSARKLVNERKVPLKDALHALIARDAEAIVITRDSHFLELADIVQSKKPEELL